MRRYRLETIPAFDQRGGNVMIQNLIDYLSLPFKTTVKFYDDNVILDNIESAKVA